jgi:hypothetical protein
MAAFRCRVLIISLASIFSMSPCIQADLLVGDAAYAGDILVSPPQPTRDGVDSQDDPAATAQRVGHDAIVAIFMLCLLFGTALIVAGALIYHNNAK